MNIVFRVENRYGSRDYDTLKEAKVNSKDEEYISIAIDYEKLSTVKRKYATPSWVRKVAKKYCLPCKVVSDKRFNVPF